MRLLQLSLLLLAAALLAACSQQAAGDRLALSYSGVPVMNLHGNWERDYSRGDDVSGVLNGALRSMQRYSPDPALSNSPYPRTEPMLSQRDIDHVVAIARLADNITDVDVLSIEHSEQAIRIERKGDYAIFCEFHDGKAAGPQNVYGKEVCGWDDHQFVSRLILPDGVRVTHRYTVAQSRDRLLVTTTVSSRQANVPITLNRFYKRFERPESDFNCVETLSMKRVCSTTEIQQ